MKAIFAILLVSFACYGMATSVISTKKTVESAVSKHLKQVEAGL